MARMLRRLRGTRRTTPSPPPWLAVAHARNQFEAEMLLQILRESDIPVSSRRSLGTDAPEAFAAGARVLLVAADRAAEAHEVLESLQPAGDPAE